MVFWIDLITIKPRRKSSISYDSNKFDEADISLLEYSELKEYLIITEDQGMLAEGVTKRRNFLQFGDLIELLFRDSHIESRDFYNIIKNLRKMKNLTKDKENKLLESRSTTELFKNY